MNLLRLLALLLCAVALSSCSRSQAQVAAPAGAYVESIDIPDAIALNDLGLTINRFTVHGLPNNKVTVWIETYRDGKLQKDLTYGCTSIPAPGKPVEEGFRFSRIRRLGETDQGPHKVIWKFGFDFTGRANSPWMDDPMPGFQSFGMPDKPPVLRPGVATTIWHLVGTDGNSTNVGDDAAIKSNPVAVLIKCRMDPVSPTDHAGGVSFDGVPLPPK